VRTSYYDGQWRGPTFSITTGEYEHVAFRVDRDNTEVEGFRNGVSQGSESYVGDDGINPGWRVGRYPNGANKFKGLYAGYWVYSAALSDQQIRDHADAMVGTSTLTTATKTYSGLRQPDFQNLSYSLNGETIRLIAIGDPDGQNEEQSVTLDGADSYPLSWSGSYSDFAVRVEMETADKTVTPTVDSVSLVG
jgi:hypothetical protein